MKFRKKPIIIEAVQWLNHKVTCPLWFIEAEEKRIIELCDDELQIHTLEGVMCRRPGDWIIRGIQGELHPCRSDIFEQTYEVVE